MVRALGEEYIRTKVLPQTQLKRLIKPEEIANAICFMLTNAAVGKLRWPDGDLGANHLICVVSEQVPEDYLAMLREKEISYVVSGKSSVDLTDAVNQLEEHFGIRTLLLEGGGHINGAFLEADLVDEVSLLVVPGIDGRHDIPAVFDGVSPSRKTAVPLRLKSVEQRHYDALWIRYEVVRSERVERRNNAKA
jgi:riboflavin biosynthesis pyrimidine reductase